MKEVIKVAEKVTGKKIPLRFGPRRAGYSPRLVVQFADLGAIVKHAWPWEVDSRIEAPI